MIILHITDILKAEGNGVAVAVGNYIKYETQNNEVGLYNLGNNFKSDYCKSYSGNDYNKISELPKPFCKPDLVVFNEVYKPKYIKLYKECIRQKIKYIIIPHGCLVKESQKRHHLKKIIGNVLLFNRFIRKANAIQFLNENEKNDTHFSYRKYIIAGNGVEKPSYKNTNDNTNKDLIFIGRYEIMHKGLDLLVKICDENCEWFRKNKIKIQLYGRDSRNELAELNKMIEDSKIKDVLVVNGPIYDKEKEKVLKKAYAFIQCSRFEGQPMGIIEALSVGVPCIVTYGTYFGEYISKNKCGFACNFDSNEIFNAIKEMINDNNLRNRFAENSYIKSNKDFNWDSVIENTIDNYKNIIKEG